MSTLETEIVALKTRVDQMEKDIAEIGLDVKAIRSKTDKWSGVMGLVYLAVPAFVGAAVGWFAGK